MSSSINAFNNVTPLVSASMPLILFFAGIFKFANGITFGFYLIPTLLCVFTAYILVKTANLKIFDCNENISAGMYSVTINDTYQIISPLIFLLIPLFIAWDVTRMINDKTVDWFKIKDIIVFLACGIMYMTFIFKSNCSFNGVSKAFVLIQMGIGILCGIAYGNDGTSIPEQAK